MIATNVYILGASYPIAGEKPTVLQEISVKTKVLDWQLNSLEVIGNKRINFLGGYHIEDIINQYPEINYIIVKNWKSNTVLNTFFQATLKIQRLFLLMLIRFFALILLTRYPKPREILQLQ